MGACVYFAVRRSTAFVFMVNQTLTYLVRRTVHNADGLCSFTVCVVRVVCISHLEVKHKIPKYTTTMPRITVLALHHDFSNIL